MPIQTSWVVPGHIVLIILAGSITLSELNAMRREIQAALGSATTLHYMIDLRTLSSIQTVDAMRFVMSRAGSFRSRKTGQVVLIGGPELAHLVFKSAATALHLTLSIVEDEQAALALLAEADIADV